MASMTKIMTAKCVLMLVAKLGSKTNFASLEAKVRCLPEISMIGTSANLKREDELTVEELLYGMMLPSGNDAAQFLAIYFGELILQSQQSQQS